MEYRLLQLRDDMGRPSSYIPTRIQLMPTATQARSLSDPSVGGRVSGANLKLCHAVLRKTFLNQLAAHIQGFA